MSQPKIVDVRARAESEPILFISRKPPNLPGRKPTSSANYSQWKKKQIVKDKKAKTHANGFGFNEKVGGPTEPFEQITIKRPNLSSMARDDVFNTGHATDIIKTRRTSTGRNRPIVRLSLNPDLPVGFAPKPLGMNLTTSGGGGPIYNHNRNLMHPPMSPLAGGDGKNIFATLQAQTSPREELSGYGEPRSQSPLMKSPWQRSPSPKEELPPVLQDEEACLTARKTPIHERPLSGQRVRIRPLSGPEEDTKPKLLIKLPEKFQCSLHQSSTSFQTNMTVPNMSRKSLHSTPSLSSLGGTLEGAYGECDSIKNVDRAPSCPPGKAPQTSNIKHSLGRRTRLPKEQLERRDLRGFDLRRPQKYSEHLSYTSLPESLSITSDNNQQEVRSQSACGYFAKFGNGRPVTLPEGWTIRPPSDVQKMLFHEISRDKMGRTI